MKKKILYISFFLFFVILQTSVFPVFFHGRDGLDLVLMMLLAWSVVDGFLPFIPWIITLGILYDLITFNIVGFHVVIFLLLAYIESFFSKRLSVDVRIVGVFIILIFVFFSTFFYKSSMNFASFGVSIFGLDFFEYFVSLKWFLLKVVYNFFCVFLFLFFYKMGKEIFFNS